MNRSPWMVNRPSIGQNFGRPAISDGAAGAARLTKSPRRGRSNVWGWSPKRHRGAGRKRKEGYRHEQDQQEASGKTCVVPGPTAEQARQTISGQASPPGALELEALIKKGVDPIYATYVIACQNCMHFSGAFSHLPRMKAYAKSVIDAETEYLPGGPPISPLTTSFFEAWVLFDLPIEKNGDTLAEFLLKTSDEAGAPRDEANVLQRFADSRMGIYEHVGLRGPFVRLRELITGDEFSCHVATGYQGQLGELWYVRLLPPLVPEVANYSVTFTTPYLLTGVTKAD